MSRSKKWTTNEKNISEVIRLYRGCNLLTLEKIALKLNTTFHNVQYIVRHHIPKEERRVLKILRYSASKAGDLNPMKGKNGAKHPNFIGDCQDGRGYLTRIHNGKRMFVHHIVMMEKLGLTEIPDGFMVHHIDGNGLNNALDNLVLCTSTAHRILHSREQDSETLRLKKSTLAAALKYMI